MARRDQKSLFDIYYEEQKKYTKLYGDKTIVFFQMGTFHTAYCTKTKGYTKLEELESLLDIHYINRENGPKSYPKGSSNQFGINSVSLKKKITIMIEHGYTVVIFDQIARDDGGALDRHVTGVYSSSAFLPDQKCPDAGYIMVGYIEDEPQLNSDINLMAIGVSIVDISTGNNMIHEFYSNITDENFGLDEIERMIQSFLPKETVIYYKPSSKETSNANKIYKYLDLSKSNSNRFYTYQDDCGDDMLDLLTNMTFNIRTQNEYYARIYDFVPKAELGKKQSPIEILGLEQKPFARIALMIMLKYISEHNIKLLKNISHPELYIYDKHLVLGNNAIGQLNIIDAHSLDVYDNRFKSVLDVVDKTSTPMGRRFLKDSLVNPLSQEEKINIQQRYDIIEELLDDGTCRVIKLELSKIRDMERLHRKMAMGKISPYEFWKLDSYYHAAFGILDKLKNKEKTLQLLEEKYSKKFDAYISKYGNILIIKRTRYFHNFKDIDRTIFQKGVYPKIDKLQEKIENVSKLLDTIKNVLSELIKKDSTLSESNNIISLESNDRDGYYYTVTKTNELTLKKKLKSMDKINISIGKKKGESFSLKPSDIIFKPLTKGRTKIFISKIKSNCDDLSGNIMSLHTMVQKSFCKYMSKLYSEEKTLLYNICKFLTKLDFLVSGAIVAADYYYCKPVIPSKDNVPSYISAKQLRHCIVERLCEDTEYIPNDIDIGNVPLKDKIKIDDRMISSDLDDDGEQHRKDQLKNGVLLYGLNSCGKSTLIKSIGISVILAQIGYYVPAQEFTFEPYMAIYARITGNDNILKGQSSFTLEMNELDCIATRTEKNGPSSLVIGDEVCRGTESISGLGIVASTIVSLSEYKCTFIFSTHLHDLPTIAEINNIDNLRFYHLRVDFDESNDCLVYDRKLTPGTGPKIYGLTVAKYIIKNHRLLNRAEIIVKKLTNKNYFDIPKTRSKYNHKLIVKKCSICEYEPLNDLYKELECHHINFQRDCLSDGKIRSKLHLTKNKLYNLAVLCHKCHASVHAGRIKIKGYLDTSCGPLLDYHIVDNKTYISSLFE